MHNVKPITKMNKKSKANDMLEEYDIDKLNPRPNPYVKELKKQGTIKRVGYLR